MGRYPDLVLDRRRWMARLIVPADVRSVIGQSVFKVSTGETDEHRTFRDVSTVALAAPGRPAPLASVKEPLNKPLLSKA